MNLPSDFWKCRCGGYNSGLVRVCPSCGFKVESRQLFGDGTGCASEAKLHEEIEEYCRKQKWPYVHSRVDLPTTTGLGSPDFLILAPGHNVLTIECKSATGKLRPEQAGWKMLAEGVGHTYYVVRSMDDFMSILREKGI